MIELHHVLAPGASRRSARLVPGTVALGVVAAFTAAATPPVVASISEAERMIDGSRAAMLVVVVTAAALAVALAHRALQAGSEMRARLWLVLGGAAAGAVATAVSGTIVSWAKGPPTIFPDGLLAGSLFGGMPLGFVFGTAFTPVVLAAFRARRAPSHDGLDRVVFAGGATLLAFGALRELLPSSLPGASLGVASAVAGAFALGIAASRIVARVRLVARAREGGEPGVHVVPRSGHEDEAPLLPLVRTAFIPAGVLAATGVSAAYRGARGVFKLALAPLPEQRFQHPLSDLVRAAAAEGGRAVLTLAVGATALLALSPMLLIFVFWDGMG